MAAVHSSPALALVPDASAAPQSLAAIRIRRCTFRRLTALETSFGRNYDVECRHPAGGSAAPLGDMESATPICNACVAPGRFRDDED
jgi:hypothetical protein